MPHRPTLAIALAASLAATLAARCGRSADVLPTSTTTMAAPPVHLFTQQTSLWRQEAEEVVRDAATWQRTWAALHGGATSEPAPAVDFAREMVVLVALGVRSTGGFAVRVDEVVGDGAGAVVRYTATVPGRGCMTSMATTAPVDVVRVPRAAGEVRFDPRTVEAPC